MTNPLLDKTKSTWVGQPAEMGRDDLFLFCAEANSSQLTKATKWWYFVAKDSDSGRMSVQKLEGSLGEEVHKFRNGWRPDFPNWPDDKLVAHSRRLAWYFKQGSLTQAPLV